jgi:hypothetical protein
MSEHDMFLLPKLSLSFSKTRAVWKCPRFSELFCTGYLFSTRRVVQKARLAMSTDKECFLYIECQ